MNIVESTRISNRTHSDGREETQAQNDTIVLIAMVADMKCCFPETASKLKSVDTDGVTTSNESYPLLVQAENIISDEEGSTDLSNCAAETSERRSGPGSAAAHLSARDETPCLLRQTEKRRENTLN